MSEKSSPYKPASYEMLLRTTDLHVNGFLGITQATENGYDIWSKWIAEYELDLVAVQDAIWKMLAVSQQTVIIFYGIGNGNHLLATGHLVHKAIRSAVKTVEFTNDRMYECRFKRSWTVGSAPMLRGGRHNTYSLTHSMAQNII